MANQIILNKQTFQVKDLISEFPDGDFKKKIFFQAELQSLRDGNAKFGIIAYPAWRDGRWIPGNPVSATDAGEGRTELFDQPFAFANNELLLPKKKKKRKGKKGKNKMRKFQELFYKISRNPKLAEKALLHCTTCFSKNPHFEYDLTLESEGQALPPVKAKPSPPARPED